jgi:hypothetical protein
LIINKMIYKSIRCINKLPLRALDHFAIRSLSCASSDVAEVVVSDVVLVLDGKRYCIVSWKVYILL